MTPEISIVLPCLNEEQALGFCLDQVKNVIKKNDLNAEIVLIDNGSTDHSQEIAKARGIIPIIEDRQGYGSAYLKGVEAARGNYFFLADVDGTYDFREIPRFLEKLKSGYDLILGNRFQGSIAPGSMPWKHRYLGNPLLSFLMRLLFKINISDTQCGMRMLSREAWELLSLRTTGMEFASEMIIKAVKKKLRISDLPINYYPRLGKSKLKSFADGWRHLRFMLLYSPLFLFLLPGILFFLLGFISLILLYLNALSVFQIRLQYHPMTLSAVLIILGYQLMVFALFAKTYAINHLGDEPVFNKLYRFLSIENVSLVGLALCLIGASIYVAILMKWINLHFGELQEIKNSILGLTFMTIGIQTIFSSFMLSILGIKEK
jgi:glycosyltransferase involved in cell wall biosynthesis